MDHMGGDYHVYFITLTGSFWNDVSVRFFQEKQFRSSVLCVLPFPGQHGKITSSSSVGWCQYF
jgi:hypothetical protein